MLKVIVGVTYSHQFLVPQIWQIILTVEVACVPTVNVKVLWAARGSASPLLEIRINPQTPETICSFSMLQVDVSGVKFGSRGMSEQMYSSPVSQLTSSTLAVSFWHSVSVVSVYNTIHKKFAYD